jgi:hypothetical protein
MVFQWNADGTEFSELNFGGIGQTDIYGTVGDSRTRAHHILGLAEAMARGLTAELVITQARAHAVPTLVNEYKVVNWLRAAAILAHRPRRKRLFDYRPGWTFAAAAAASFG